MTLQIKLILAAVLVAVLALGEWYAMSKAYDAGHDACVAAQKEANTKAEVKQQAKVVAADTSMQQVIDTGAVTKADTEQHTQTVVRTITKVIHDAPSPVACVAQPDSVRELASAIDRANAATDRLQGTRAISAPAAAASASQP